MTTSGLTGGSSGPLGPRQQTLASNSGTAALRSLAQPSATLRTLSAPLAIGEAGLDLGGSELLAPAAGNGDGTLTRPLTRAELSLCLLAEVSVPDDWLL